MEKIEISGVGLEVMHIRSKPASTPLAPLIFLHEGLGSVAMWRDWPATVCEATGRAGWVYSRRGYGQSDPVPSVRGAPRMEGGQRVGRLLPDYLHAEAWEVLPKLLTALDVESPVLIGHSDGGSIGLLHASRFDVAACVVMAPHVMVEDLSIESIRQARLAYESGNLRERLARHHADVDGAFWQWNDVWLSEGFRSFDIRDNCRTIRAPLLAIQGFDDPYGTMLQIDEILRVMAENGDGVSPNHRIELQKLKQCGHSAHRDQPEESRRLIAEFLQNLP
jgi:pimeloyl-ACP methyl ester carboxylesterase